MEHMPFEERYRFIVDNLRDSYCVRIVQTISDIRHKYDAKNIHDGNLSEGYEGSILRTNDVYKCGRSWSLRKFKDFSDAEATIIGYVDGKGKREGTKANSYRHPLFKCIRNYE
jgi:ATP-dependent DNA ligase